MLNLQHCDSYNILVYYQIIYKFQHFSIIFEDKFLQYTKRKSDGSKVKLFNQLMLSIYTL